MLDLYTLTMKGAAERAGMLADVPQYTAMQKTYRSHRDSPRT